jgi:hypothetical protein
MWPNWTNRLTPDDQSVTRSNLRDLARYANPAMLSGLGLGLGLPIGFRESRLHPKEAALLLSENLVSERHGWMVERFNPRGSSEQGEFNRS